MQKMEISSASADLSRPDLCLRRCLRRCMIWHSLTFLCSYLQVSWRLTWFRVVVTDVWFGHFSHSISPWPFFVQVGGPVAGANPGRRGGVLIEMMGGDQIIAFIDVHHIEGSTRAPRTEMLHKKSMLFGSKYGSNSGKINPLTRVGARSHAAALSRPKVIQKRYPRGNFHSRTGWLVHSLNEILNVLEFKNWSQAVILLLGGWAEHFIGKGNPDDF